MAAGIWRFQVQDYLNLSPGAPPAQMIGPLQISGSPRPGARMHRDSTISCPIVPCSLWALVTWNPTSFDPCEPTKVDILCPSIIRPLCEDMSVIRRLLPGLGSITTTADRWLPCYLRCLIRPTMREFPAKYNQQPTSLLPRWSE